MSINAILQGTNITIKDDTIPTVGMGVTYFIGSDRYPFHISKVINNRKVEIQRATHRRTDKNGFSENQTYEITPDPTAPAQVITKRKNGRWIPQGSPMHCGGCYLIGKADAYSDPSF